MTTDEFYATVLLALGPPDPYTSPWGNSEYARQFLTIGMKADLFGYRAHGSMKYPLSPSEEIDQYSALFRDFVWWFSNRDAKERNW
jgi:hypothetical protein